jgi:hypothetical protein
MKTEIHKVFIELFRASTRVLKNIFCVTQCEALLTPGTVK